MNNSINDINWISSINNAIEKIGEAHQLNSAPSDTINH